MSSLERLPTHSFLLSSAFSSHRLRAAEKHLWTISLETVNLGELEPSSLMSHEVEFKTPLLCTPSRYKKQQFPSIP